MNIEEEARLTDEEMGEAERSIERGDLRDEDNWQEALRAVADAATAKALRVARLYPFRIQPIIRATESLLSERPPCHDGTLVCGGCDWCVLEMALAELVGEAVAPEEKEETP